MPEATPYRETVRLADHLPALFRQGSPSGDATFLEQFLAAFQVVVEDLASGIGSVHRWFDPDASAADLAPDDPDRGRFLEWLSGWVALSLRADLPEDRRREFIRRAVSLYRLRGTRRGLEEVLSIYTALPAVVSEMHTAFQIGVSSRIGVDTTVGGGAPHFFRVLLRVPTADLERIRWYREVADSIIDMEKPAHTRYALDVETPTLQIGVRSRIGVDTLLSPPRP
jgi:phage tail-like protein